MGECSTKPVGRGSSVAVTAGCACRRRAAAIYAGTGAERRRPSCTQLTRPPRMRTDSGSIVRPPASSTGRVLARATANTELSLRPGRTQLGRGSAFIISSRSGHWIHAAVRRATRLCPGRPAAIAKSRLPTRPDGAHRHPRSRSAHVDEGDLRREARPVTRVHDGREADRRAAHLDRARRPVEPVLAERAPRQLDLVAGRAQAADQAPADRVVAGARIGVPELVGDDLAVDGEDVPAAATGTCPSAAAPRRPATRPPARPSRRGSSELLSMCSSQQPRAGDGSVSSPKCPARSLSPVAPDAALVRAASGLKLPNTHVTTAPCASGTLLSAIDHPVERDERARPAVAAHVRPRDAARPHVAGVVAARRVRAADVRRRQRDRGDVRGVARALVVRVEPRAARNRRRGRLRPAAGSDRRCVEVLIGERERRARPTRQPSADAAGTRCRRRADRCRPARAGRPAAARSAGRPCARSRGRRPAAPRAPRRSSRRARPPCSADDARGVRRPAPPGPRRAR